jgi:hypothetical protein
MLSSEHCPHLEYKWLPTLVRAVKNCTVAGQLGCVIHPAHTAQHGTQVKAILPYQAQAPHLVVLLLLAGATTMKSL